MLPDDVLLDIFDFYRKIRHVHNYYVWRWHVLVRVCRRWRHIIFASPLRLNLQILCTDASPVRKSLGIWPPYPIVLDSFIYSEHNDGDNVAAALEHFDRVCAVSLLGIGSRLGKFVTLMQEQYPALICLRITSTNGTAPVLPPKFLGGSAPCLQEIALSAIPYPTLPTLLLSASGLVSLRLRKIPPTGYISPETMVACLAAFPRLKTLIIEFQSTWPHPEQIRPPPVARTVLHSLIFFQFRGASEYLEDLIAEVDSPQVNQIEISYLNQFVDFQVPQLSQFIDYSMSPRLNRLGRADVSIYSDRATFTLYHYAGWDHRHPVRITISCESAYRQVFRMAQVLSQFSATLSTVIRLELEARFEGDNQLEDTDDLDWLHLLLRFPATQVVCVSVKLAGFVALALENIAGEMVDEVPVLPNLDLICLENQPASSVEKFVAVRRLSGRQLTAVGTQSEFIERLESYIGK